MMRTGPGWGTVMLITGWSLAILGTGETRAERGFPAGPVYSSPEAVRFAQRVLEAGRLLKPGTCTPGELDPPTIDAIRRFQRDHFLRPSGRIDPDTMGLLSSHAPDASGSRRLAESASVAPGRREEGPARAKRAAAATMPETDIPIRTVGIAAARPTYARLRVGRLGMDARVVEGTDPASLTVGPGHMPGSAAPGDAGNCIIAGHRDGIFGRLHELLIGDLLEMDGPSGAAAYRVGAIEVVERADVRPLAPAATPVLTLVTCHPLRHAGPAPQRLVVRADLVAPRTSVPPARPSL